MLESQVLRDDQGFPLLQQTLQVMHESDGSIQREAGWDDDSGSELCASDEGTKLDIDDQADKSICLLYTSPSPRDRTRSRMPSSA